MCQRAFDTDASGAGIADFVQHQERQEAGQYPRQSARHDRAHGRHQHHHTQGRRPCGGLVENMAGRFGMGNAEVRAQALCDRQPHLNDADRAQRPPLPVHREPPRLPVGRRPHGGQLGAARQAAHQLGLFDRCRLPLAAWLAAGEVLVDARGGDGFALPVDTSRQRLTSGVAVHDLIVAYGGRIVPAPDHIGISLRRSRAETAPRGSVRPRARWWWSGWCRTPLLCP